MNSLTDTEIIQITRLERDAGVQMLSGHFQWAEFGDKRLCFHQEFVYDVVMFAADQGFSQPSVIRSAMLAKNLFPQLDGLNMLELSTLLRHLLSELLPDLTPVQQHEFTRFLVDTCVIRRRLFQAVVGGRTDLSVSLIHLEVQLPPTPLPLAQGTDLLQLETETQAQSEVASSLQQTEEERRLQQADLTTGGRHSPAPQETAPGKEKTKTAKTGTRGKGKAK